MARRKKESKLREKNIKIKMKKGFYFLYRIFNSFFFKYKLKYFI